jgi:anaerobic ribonucleoside-triphosphate reductase
MKKDLEKKRTKCEVYSRVIGYIRPVDNWNDGKRSEWEQRVPYAKLGLK